MQPKTADRREVNDGGSALFFRLLGPLEIWQHGEPVTVPANKQRILLALLLLRSNRVVVIDEIIQYLWGDEPPVHARRAAQTYIARLRQLLRELGGNGLLQSSGEGYHLRIENSQLDLLRFEELVRAAENRESPSETAALLGEALELWHGRIPLPDVDSCSLQHEEVPRLMERALAVRERRYDIELELGRHTALIADLTSATSECPFHERFWHQLILALYGAGRQGDALNTYRQLRELLAEQMGVDPSPELQELHQRVLTGDRDLAASRAVERPQPTSRPTPSPRQLPPDIRGFTGRTICLRRLDQLLGSMPTNQTPIVVISGMAGVGKSALAVHWAYRCVSSFPDGQLYVDLHHSPCPGAGRAHIPGLLRGLGHPPQEIPADPVEQQALYRSSLACQRMVIVVDGARCPEQVRPLLPGQSNSTVLVTSRYRMRGLVARNGAISEPLGVFDQDEGVELLDRLLGHDRITTDPDTTHELVRLSGRLPLALQVIATYLEHRPSLALREYARRLARNDRLAQLVVPGDHECGVLPAFDDCYSGIGPREQRLLRILGGIGTTPFTAESVAEQASLPLGELERALEALSDAHLLEEVCPHTYALHPLVDLYIRTHVLSQGRSGWATRGRAPRPEPVSSASAP